MRPDLRSFLLSLDTASTRHGTRTLFDHLKGVHDLLRDWDNDEDVCNAGLFHSIYGTSSFKHKSLHDREPLVKLIGGRAESLAYQFSLGERPLFKNIENEERRRDLQEVEAANLVEQHAGSRFLRQLLPMKLSDGARAAILLELT